MEGQISLKSGGAEVTLFSILVMRGRGGTKGFKVSQLKIFANPPSSKK